MPACTCRELDDVRRVNPLCPTHGDKKVAGPQKEEK